MGNNLKWTICLLLIVTTRLLSSNNWKPVLELATEQGLPSNEVQQVFQDREGFMWFATKDGFCRYDGYNMKIYKSNLYSPDLLSSNNVLTVTEDYNNNIWIGTDNGLNILNKKTGLIKKISQDVLHNTKIQALCIDRDEQVWIGTADGIECYIPSLDTFVYYNNANTNYNLRGNDIKTIIEDTSGDIWFGTWNEGLVRYDKKSEKFISYPSINESNSAHILFQDNKNNIWVGTWNHGLYRILNPYNIDEVSYENYKHSSQEKNSLSDNIVYSISQDSYTGNIWVGTRSGLSVLQSKENYVDGFINYIPNKKENYLKYNEITSIIQDDNGLMWIGTLGGGVYLVNTQKDNFNLNTLNAVLGELNSNSVRSIFVDEDENVWLGIGSYGLAMLNPKKKDYTFFGNANGFENNPIESTVNFISQPTTKNEIWFATNGQGIFIYNVSQKEVLNIKVETHPWLRNNVVNYIKKDSRGYIWIGTEYGLSLYNTVNETGTSLFNFGNKINNVNILNVTCIEEGDDGIMLIGTEKNGIFYVENNSVNPGRGVYEINPLANGNLNQNRIECIFKDSKERIWLGSRGYGLNLYNKKDKLFESVHMKYNIPGDIVYGIEEYGNNLWLGTNNGLIKIVLSDSLLEERVIVKQFTTSDGLQDNSFNSNAVFKTKEGVLYFGGHKGYNYFNPEGISDKVYRIPLLITDIKISNKSFETLDAKLRSRISDYFPGYTNKLQLPYSLNNVSVEFAALSYGRTKQIKYAYMLKGFDSNWHYVDANRRYALYNNLKAGDYQLLLKTTDGHGNWDVLNSDLFIEVLPSKWRVWWAIIIYILLSISMLFSGILFVKSKIRLTDTLRIMDIEKQKSEELNHAKLQFFTNISHDFLTPLTIISASVDELKIITPVNQDLYSVMSDNVNRLIRLIQQVLEFRKAESGNLKLKVARGNIASFIQKEVDSFIPLMKKNKLHFSFISEMDSIDAYFDHDKLDKILFNLLSNASKYNLPGSFIQVNVVFVDEKKEKIRISIKDNGDGISPELQAGLFKRFYEGDYRRYKTLGTGIGLSLTKDLVELHKGSIEVKSEKGHGTTFSFEIPISSRVYLESEIDNYSYISDSIILEEEIDTVAFELDEQKHSLLIIEDNEQLLGLITRLLSKDYNVFPASNAKEGIQILENEYINLAISDIMMPEMDGIEFCKYVKSKVEISHVPIILLTAKNKEEDRIVGYESGADGYITKPFNVHVLLSKISNLLKSKESAAQEFTKYFSVEGKNINYTSLDEEFLTKAVQCVYDNIDDSDFDQQQFADILGTSKSTLYKKLKSLTGLNTSAFIKEIRLKTASKIIQEKKKIRISELAYAVGFNDPKYFSSCFKKKYGLIPSDYIEKLISTDGKITETEE